MATVHQKLILNYPINLIQRPTAKFIIDQTYSRLNELKKTEQSGNQCHVEHDQKMKLMIYIFRIDFGQTTM